MKESGLNNEREFVVERGEHLISLDEIFVFLFYFGLREYRMMAFHRNSQTRCQGLGKREMGQGD
jgi:hypothetical protein